MNLLELTHRQPVAQPWVEGEKIPWNEPGFSRRMLREHLSQQHDAASRRFEIIDQHVRWIHGVILGEKPTRILDLGCGPGLYSNRLTQLGHTCTGIDFSPASIAYARSKAQLAGLESDFRLEDIRTAQLGRDYGMAMLIYGEFNVFKPVEAQSILTRVAAALRSDGRLLLEVSTFASVKGIGCQPRHWSAQENGLFSDDPHLYLYESFWDDQQKTATERYYVVDARSGKVTAHAATTQAYRISRLKAMFFQAGFKSVQVYPSLTGEKTAQGQGFVVLLAQR